MREKLCLEIIYLFKTKISVLTVILSNNPVMWLNVLEYPMCQFYMIFIVKMLKRIDDLRVSEARERMGLAQS